MTFTKKAATFAALVLSLSACGSSGPKVIQTLPGAPEVHLTAGIATQIEMPENARVQSVVIGNPALATAEQSGNIVSLTAKTGSGETNMIIRSVDDSGHTKVDQYRVTVQQN